MGLVDSIIPHSTTMAVSPWCQLNLEQESFNEDLHSTGVRSQLLGAASSAVYTHSFHVEHNTRILVQKAKGVGKKFRWRKVSNLKADGNLSICAHFRNSYKASLVARA